MRTRGLCYVVLAIMTIYRYLDAVALPRRFGKPDMFITMTANPQWPEISSAIPANSHWSYHQDIVGRVFYMKLLALMDFIVNKQLFGEVSVVFCMCSHQSCFSGPCSCVQNRVASQGDAPCAHPDHLERQSVI